ncbi:MAG: VIT domain-containing protein [Thermoguttaceae bacterium]|nr:VIT domain-containing protein [Thermoguttaceae bacterium]MDW8039435.1 VIT domain-containing protein [Thermoguttaceae bacterium]
MGRWMVGLGMVLVFLLPLVAQAQGVLVVEDPGQSVRLPRPGIIWPPPYPPPHPPRPVPPPPPPATYKIKELSVNAKITDQVASVQVTQSFVNTGSRQLEVSFIFPLPYDGAVDQLTLMVDGKEYPAKLMKAEEARRLYEDIVRKNKDPALLEWIGTGLFKTSVFPVPPGAERKVILRYNQLCRKFEGLTDFLFPLSTAKYTADPVDEISFRISIESQDDIKNVYSPTHPVDIKRPDDKHATVTWKAEKQIPTSDFRLFYDVGKGTVSTRLISYRPSDKDDGYFLLLASPKIEQTGERPKKTVIFVVDRSGSMSGKKIEQARNAAKFILNNLREGDTFNIIAYDSTVEAFRPELQRYNEETRRAAQGFIEGLYAGGSTNIDGALKAALAQLTDSSRPSYVIFLTDGLPTAGETNEMKIVANAKENNKVRARIFAFGVGYDVNARLLDRLVTENFGQSEYVRPEQDLEDAVSRFYRRIESPVMTDVKIEITVDTAKPEDGPIVNRVYPKGIIDLFAGQQLVLVGRYKKPGAAKVVVQGKVGDQTQKLDFPANLVEKSPDESLGFVEKLWAIRRIGEILDELDLKGKNEELIKELVELATRHGVVTPYTSFLADENAPIGAVTANVERARQRLEVLAQADGFGGVGQRAFRGQFRDAQQAALPAAAPPGDPNSGRILAEAAQAFKEAGKALAAKSGTLGQPAAEALLADADRVDRELAQATQNMRQVGNRTFYRRQNQWIDSTLTEDQQKNVQRIKQFSREYFDLAARYGRTMAQYLVFDEPVMVNLGGQAYLIEP